MPITAPEGICYPRSRTFVRKFAVNYTINTKITVTTTKTSTIVNSCTGQSTPIQIPPTPPVTVNGLSRNFTLKFSWVGNEYICDNKGQYYAWVTRMSNELDQMCATYNKNETTDIPGAINFKPVTKTNNTCNPPTTYIDYESCGPSRIITNTKVEAVPFIVNSYGRSSTGYC